MSCLPSELLASGHDTENKTCPTALNLLLSLGIYNFVAATLSLLLGKASPYLLCIQLRALADY